MRISDWSSDVCSSDLLTEYLHEAGLKVRYIHSDVDTLERIEIIRDLRLGVFDVLVGINLLREGLDIPECSLVCILDADKEGFLRSTRRSEEHTSELQSLMRISYAVFCLKKKTQAQRTNRQEHKHPASTP